MAGKIIADQIEHSTAGSLDTSYVVQGSAKAWAFIEGTGTPSITGSFNVASLTDVQTGVVRANFTNNMNNANFSNLGTPREDSSIVSIQELKAILRATSSMVLKTHSTSTTVDTEARNYVLFGDLA